MRIDCFNIIKDPCFCFFCKIPEIITTKISYASYKRKIFSILGEVKNKKILVYYPLKNEVNLKKTILKLRKNNQVYLPFMEHESFKAVKYRLPLQQKKFGTFEAGNSLKHTNIIDIAIVPVIGIDKNLQRVGFGKGMYDRFFSKLQKKPYTIFVQADLCFTKEIVCDHYDIGCDVVVTPKLIIKNENI